MRFGGRLWNLAPFASCGSTHPDARAPGTAKSGNPSYRGQARLPSASRTGPSSGLATPALLSSPLLLMRPAFVPEGGRAARPSPPGALRAALTARPLSLGSWPAVMSSSTESERRSNMSATQRTLTFKLDANLGSDPVLRSTRERVYTQSWDAETQPLARWHRRIDWQGLTAAYRKGDRVCLSGFFRVRKHQQDGEGRQFPEIVFTDARLERSNVHVEALIDEAVERQFHKLAHQFRTLSLAVNTRDAEAQPLTRWY